jgi:hypothetical protein
MTRNWEGGQHLRRTTALRHAAGGGPRPGPAAPSDDRQAAATPHTTPPRISICPDPVLAVHTQSPPASGSHDLAEKAQLPIAEQIFFYYEGSPRLQPPVHIRTLVMH